MHLALFGATGHIGRLILDQALAAGHTLAAFTRDRTRLPAPSAQLRVIEGMLEDGESVPETLLGAEAVLVALAAGHGTLAAFDEAALYRMEDIGPRRIVSMVGASVRMPGDPDAASLQAMSALMHLVPGGLLADAEGHAQRLAASALDWTLVRSANHKDHAATGVFHAEPAFAMHLSAGITRADLAAFMLDCAVNGRFIKAAPMVQNG